MSRPNERRKTEIMYHSEYDRMTWVERTDGVVTGLNWMQGDEPLEEFISSGYAEADIKLTKFYNFAKNFIGNNVFYEGINETIELYWHLKHNGIIKY